MWLEGGTEGGAGSAGDVSSRQVDRVQPPRDLGIHWVGHRHITALLGFSINGPRPIQGIENGTDCFPNGFEAGTLIRDIL